MIELEEEEKDGYDDLSIEELRKENESLKREFEREKVLNEKYKTQLNWSESTSSIHSKPAQLTVGQEKVYSSSIETMRAVFSNYDSGNGVDIKFIPQLHHNLGEIINEEEGKISIDDIRKLCKRKLEDFDGKVPFNIFLKYWIKKYKKSNQKAKFKLTRYDLSKKGEVELSRIVRRYVGREGTLSFRVRYYYREDDLEEKPISPWHDIPLYRFGSGLKAKFVSFVCEIPKWTRAKYEIATREIYNPIKQDVKYGRLRFYKHGDLAFNYGLLPQTWEDPSHVSKDTGKKGDNDPIDAIEIGTRQREVGEIVVVKILGVLGLIDSDETDWKVITIGIDDPISQKIHDISDVEVYIPGAITAIREYFRIYKVCTGNKENQFSFGELPKGREYALRLVEETHNFWKKLREDSEEGVVPN